MDIETYQKRLKNWLGSDPRAAAVEVAHATGYTPRYILWAAGVYGQKPWPGSKRFMRRMQRAGFDCPVQEMPPALLARALRQRVTLYLPEAQR